MTITNRIFTVLSTAVALLSGVAGAQDSVPATKNAPAGKTTALTAMQQAFEGTNWATDKKPNLRAKYYIYLISASWCGPCQRLMPGIVAAYKNDMKEGKLVEVILTACEQTMDGVPAYLAKYNAGFPGIHISAPDVARFVGFDKNDMKKGIPFVVICDNNGRVLDKGHGAFSTWKETIKKDLEAKKAAKK